MAKMMPPPGATEMPPFQALLDKIRAEPLGKPNATVYVQNLNERVKTADLKNSLFQLFS